jgi:L-lysine 2,3-aminomutase
MILPAKHTDRHHPGNPTAGRKYQVITAKDIDRLPQLATLSRTDRIAMKAVAAVLPFRVNNYVIDELIDWSNVPHDPMYQLTFPQPGMLSPADLSRITHLVSRDAPSSEVEAAARRIQHRLNPHPAGQMDLNVPMVNGLPANGIQHKYRETVLFFPAAGQTCHAYCTYCFRWAQFVGIDELKFADRQAEGLVRYLKTHQEVSSVLITGGDPLVMRTKVLRRYIEPLLDDKLEHVTTIRIGSKAPAYWPYRFVTDPDADDLLRLFEHVKQRGKHLALMAHYSHPRELSTSIAQEALARVQRTGAVVRTQAPLIRHVNADADTWSEMWQTQVRLGAVPYYMFVERDTGPKGYFEVPLAHALVIFHNAYRQLNGLGRTVRGPSMSATPGKVLVDGVTTINGEPVFVLKFLQARNPEWVGHPFFARYDRKASWLDDLRPALGLREFFYEKQLRELQEQKRATRHLGSPSSRPESHQTARASTDEARRRRALSAQGEL